MFLTPPSLVDKKDGFVPKEEYEKNGFKLWDGTNKDLRAEYPDDLSHSRREGARKIAEMLKVKILEALDHYGEATAEFVEYRPHPDSDTTLPLFLPLVEARVSLMRSSNAGYGRGAPGSNSVVMQLSRAADKWVEWSPGTSHRCLYKSIGFFMGLFSRSQKREREERDIGPSSVREFLEGTNSNTKKWNNAAAHTKSLAKAAWKKIYSGENDEQFPPFGANYAVCQVLASVYNVTIRIFGTNFRLLELIEPVYEEVKLQRCPKPPPYAYKGFGKRQLRYIDTIDLRLSSEHYSVLIPREVLKFYHTFHGLDEFSESEHLPLSSISVHRELRQYQIPRHTKYHLSDDPSVPLERTHATYDITGAPIPRPRFQLSLIHI